MLLVHGFLVLRESRRSLSVEPVQLVTLWAKVTCTGMNGVEIMTRVPRRHGDRHGESKGTSTKFRILRKWSLLIDLFVFSGSSFFDFSTSSLKMGLKTRPKSLPPKKKKREKAP